MEKQSNLVSDQPISVDPELEALVASIRERARNLYLSRQLLCTESAARLILKKRPELATGADKVFLSKRESTIKSIFLRLIRLFR